MASFNAPTLFTEIDRAIYESQINENFVRLQAALNNLQNIIPSLGGAGNAPSSFAWIRNAILPDGVIGRESFRPVFTDGASAVVQVTHPGNDSASAAVIQNAYHNSSVVFVKDLTLLTTTSDETIEIGIGLKTLGSPAVEYVVGETNTDYDANLILFTFDLTVVGGATWFSKNLRRSTDVVLDRNTFASVEKEESSISFSVPGSLGQSIGVLPHGFVAPYDLDIQEAQFYLATASADGQDIEVQLVDELNLTDGNVLAGSALWDTTDPSGLLLVAGKTQPTVVPKGRRILLEVVQSDGSTDSTAGDLMVTVLVRKHLDEIL